MKNTNIVMRLLLFAGPIALGLAVFLQFRRSELTSELVSGGFLVAGALVLSTIVAFSGNAKIMGIYILLLLLWLFLGFDVPQKFFGGNNIENIVERTALYGVLGIGVAFVIITGGIDLSIGSVVCLMGCLLAMFLSVNYAPFDQQDVLLVQAKEKVIVVQGSEASLSEGDHIWYYGGRRAGNKLVHVTKVEPTEAPLDEKTGTLVPATAVHVDAELSRDDTMGHTAKVFGLVSIDRGDPEAEPPVPATAVMKGEHPNIEARDEMSFVDPEKPGLKKVKVKTASIEGGNTRLTLIGDLGTTVTEKWLAVPEERKQRMPVLAGVSLVLAIGLALGLLHGLLVTKMGMQPFVVTLCGLLFYRGFARWLADDQPQGFGAEYADNLSKLGEGKATVWTGVQSDLPVSFGIPNGFFVMLIAAIVAGVFLNRTIWGRYMLALGRNEEAARYSGISTNRVTVTAYVICTGLAALGGMLFALDANSVSPSSFGNFFELYAIAAAVLGGCSLRGGEGSILGVVIGTALMQTLYNLIVLVGISDKLEMAIIGAVILAGVLADELVKRIAARRRAQQRAAAI